MARTFSLLSLMFLLGLCQVRGAAVSHASPIDLRLGDWHRRELAPGVELLQRSFANLFGGPQVIHLLRVDLNEPAVTVRFAAAARLGERVAILEEIAAAAGAVAAINGGFGHGGPDLLNSGIFKIDGEVLPFLRQESEELRFVGGAAIGIDNTGKWHFTNRPGDEWPEDWPEMPHALAGGHRLIEGGEISRTLSTFISARDRRHSGGRHPRTAIGIRPDGIGILLAIDGRHPGHAEGITLPELAHLMKTLGCVDALNLDGGGSTTMWARDEGLVNHPSDNQSFDHEGSRRVCSAVVILAE